MNSFYLKTAALQAFRDTMLDIVTAGVDHTPNNALRTLLAYPSFPGVFRIYGDDVPTNVPMPYVTIEHYSGGMDNDTRTDASYSLWKVAGHTREDATTAEALEKLIFETLNWRMPVTPANVRYAGYAPILLRLPFTDTAYKQSFSTFRAGGIYSLCLAETKE